MKSASVDLILKFGLLVSCFFVTGGSLYSGCDNGCRLKTYFMLIGTPNQYWMLDSSDCLDCVSPGTRCNNNILPAGTCTDTKNPLHNKTGTTTGICSGFGGDIVEANIFTSLNNWNSFGTNHTCQ